MDIAVKKPLSGFSIIELIIVLVLISALAAVAVPRLPRAETFNVQAQAERFASDLRRARMLAMTQFRSLCVRVGTDPPRYFVSEYSAGSCDKDSINDPLTGSFVVELGSSVSLDCVNGTGTGVCGSFRFRSNGAPSAGARFSMAAAAGRSFEISVAGNSGAVTVMEL